MSESMVVADYYPLAAREVMCLLNIVECQRRKLHIITAIQVRLEQAVIGCVCPRPKVGDVARSIDRLNQMFDQFLKDPNSKPRSEIVADFLDTFSGNV